MAQSFTPTEVVGSGTLDGTDPGASYAVIGAASYDTYQYSQIVVTAIVHSVTGSTPTLDLKLQQSPDPDADYDNWTDVKAFTQITAAGASSIYIPDGTIQAFGRYIRVVGQTGGTTPVFVTTIVFAPKE